MIIIHQLNGHYSKFIQSRLTSLIGNCTEMLRTCLGSANVFKCLVQLDSGKHRISYFLCQVVTTHNDRQTRIWIALWHNEHVWILLAECSTSASRRINSLTHNFHLYFQMGFTRKVLVTESWYRVTTEDRSFCNWSLLAVIGNIKSLVIPLVITQH